MESRQLQLKELTPEEKIEHTISSRRQMLTAVGASLANRAGQTAENRRELLGSRRQIRRELRIALGQKASISKEV